LPNNLTAPTTTFETDAALNDLLPFYLHEDPALDIRPLLACFQLALGLEPENENSSVIPVRAAAFGVANSDFALRALTDAAYIEALRRHPLRRKEQKQAGLTIIAMSPLLSFSIPDGLALCAKVVPSTHVQRMDKIQRVVATFLDRPRPHTTAVFCNGCRLDVLGLTLHETLRKYHPLILSSLGGNKENDMHFGAKRTILKRVNTLGHLVIPPFALKPDWFPRVPFTPWSERKTKLAVDIDIGQWQTMRKAYAALAGRVGTDGLAPNFGMRATALRPEMLRVLALNEAQFALVIDGKNFHEFFDAVAFGTVPIFMSDMLGLRQAMPFGDAVNWDQVFFGIDGMGCIREQQEAVGLLLERQIKTSAAKIDWQQVSTRLLQIYREYLTMPDYMPDYRQWIRGQGATESGVDAAYEDVTSPAVTALLRSLAKVKHVTSTTADKPAAVTGGTGGTGAASPQAAGKPAKRTRAPTLVKGSKATHDDQEAVDSEDEGQ